MGQPLRFRQISFAAAESFLGPLAIFNVRKHSEPLENVSVLIAQRNSANQKPPIFALGAPMAGFVFKRFTTRQRRTPLAEVLIPLVRMNRRCPAFSKGLFRRQEIQDLIALTRVLADRRDTLALGALLRGPLVGLTEEELLDIVWALPRPEGAPQSLPRLDLGVPLDSVAHPHAREPAQQPGACPHLRPGLEGHQSLKVSRRTFLRSSSAALVGLSAKGDRKIAGSFVNESFRMGHLLRDRATFPAARRVEKYSVVIVGGGIAGLSAAWRLRKNCW